MRSRAAGTALAVAVATIARSAAASYLRGRLKAVTAGPVFLGAIVLNTGPAGAEENPAAKMPRPPVLTRKSPSGVAPPVGAYSHMAIARAGSELIVLAGQLGVSPEGDLPSSVEEQCANALVNARRLLASEGVGPENIIKVNVWLVEPIERARFSELWAEFVDGNPPPTMLAYVAGLSRPEYLVEVEVWAVR